MKKTERGISLVEIVVVVGAVVFLGFLIASLPQAIASITKNRHASLAKDIVNQEVDRLRKQTYANLANGTSTFVDTRTDSLAGAAAVYEITDCPEVVCGPEGLELKQVKVLVSWNESGDNKKVEMTTLVGEGGLGQ